MRPVTVEITVCQTKLRVKYRYCAGFSGTRDEPPESAGFEIEEITLACCPQEDIQILLSDYALVEIDTALWNEQEAAAEAAAEAIADYPYEHGGRDDT